MEGQINLFDYIAAGKVDFPKIIASGLIKYCREWNYNWIEKLKQDSTDSNFYKLFCSTTKTYYIFNFSDYYAVTFSKNGAASVKKCGPDFDERGLDSIVTIQSIVEYLT